MKETQAINKSLSSLGDVIAALGSGKGEAHVPYRNSKVCLKKPFEITLLVHHMLTIATVDLPSPILARRHSSQWQIKPHAHDAAPVAARRTLAREQKQFAVRKQSPRDAHWSGEEAMIALTRFSHLCCLLLRTVFHDQASCGAFLRCWDGCTGRGRFLPPACNCFCSVWEMGKGKIPDY